VDGWVVLPEPARGEHRVRIFGSTAAAVVAAEREEQVAALALEVVAQDDAAEAQVGLHVKEPAGIAVADRARPKRHHLRVAARARDRDRVLAKVALDLHEAEQQRRLEPGTLALVPERLQELDAGDELGLLPAQPIAHRAEPAQIREPLVEVGERRLRRRGVGDRGGERAANGVGERLLDLRTGERCARPRRDERRRDRRRDERAASSPARGECLRHAASLPFTKASASATVTVAGAASRRPWTSTVPAFRPRSESTTRVGTPISSQSANIAPGRSPRSSRMASMPASTSSAESRSAASRTASERS